MRLPVLAGALESLPTGADVHLRLAGLGLIDPACRELLETWQGQHVARGGQVTVEDRPGIAGQPLGPQPAQPAAPPANADATA